MELCGMLSYVQCLVCITCALLAAGVPFGIGASDIVLASSWNQALPG